MKKLFLSFILLLAFTCFFTVFSSCKKPQSESGESTEISSEESLSEKSSTEENSSESESINDATSESESTSENQTKDEIFYPDSILIIEGFKDESQQLVRMLESENCEYKIVVASIDEADSMPKTIDDLKQYGEIILSNVSYTDLRSITEDFEEILYEYVNDFGGGLLTIGGNEQGLDEPHAYDERDMYGTDYQKLLPVEIEEYTAPIAVMLLIDKSGSMGAVDDATGKTLLELVQDGAIECLNCLTERDYCGVMSLDSVADEILGCTSVANKSSIIDAIQSLTVGGGTVFSGPIREAGIALMAITGVEKRHIILVSDCITDDPLAQYGKQIKQNYDNGITMSIIHIGGGANSADAREAAEMYGHGRYYELTEYSTIPSKMHELIKDLIDTELNPRSYTLTADPLSVIFEDVQLENLPQIDGFYYSKLKSGASSLLSCEYATIYAQWDYGKGNVGSFMCDLNGNWSSSLISDVAGEKIIYNIVMNLFSTQFTLTTE